MRQTIPTNDEIGDPVVATRQVSVATMDVPSPGSTKKSLCCPSLTQMIWSPTAEWNRIVCPGFICWQYIAHAYPSWGPTKRTPRRKKCSQIVRQVGLSPWILMAVTMMRDRRHGIGRAWWRCAGAPWIGIPRSLMAVQFQPKLPHVPLNSRIYPRCSLWNCYTFGRTSILCTGPNHVLGCTSLPIPEWVFVMFSTSFSMISPYHRPFFYSNLSIPLMLTPWSFQATAPRRKAAAYSGGLVLAPKAWRMEGSKFGGSTRIQWMNTWDGLKWWICHQLKIVLRCFKYLQHWDLNIKQEGVHRYKWSNLCG